MKKFFKGLWKVISILFGKSFTGIFEKGYDDATRNFRR